MAALPDYFKPDSAPDYFTPDEPAKDEPGMGEAVARGAGQGFTLGYGDEINGGIQALYDKLGDKSGTPLAELYRRNRDTFRREDRAAHDAHPAAYNIANIAGSIPTTVAASALGVPATLAGSIGSGATQALGNSDADLTKGEYGQAAYDTALGAGTAGMLHGVGAGISKIPQALENSSLRQMRRAITGGGNALTNKAALSDEAVAVARDVGHYGDSTPKLYERLEAARQAAGESHGNLIKNDLMGSERVEGPNAPALYQKLMTEAKKAHAVGNTEAEGEYSKAAQRLADIAQSSGHADATGNLPLDQAEKIKSVLQQRARDEYNKLGGSGLIGDARKGAAAIHNAADEQAVYQGIHGESNGPHPEGDLYNRFLASKENYGNLAAATDMAERGAKSAAQRPAIGFKPMMGAVGMMAHGNLPGAAMVLGGGALLQKYGGVAGAKATGSIGATLGNIGKRLQLNPASLGKYGGVLSAAIQRGTQANGEAGGKQALATTHFMLSQTNPDYQQLMHREPEEDDAEMRKAQEALLNEPNEE